MRNFFLTLILAFSTVSCQSDSNEIVPTSDLIGSWKLVQIYGSDGANGQWTTINDGYTYQFKNDMTLVSDRFGCDGNYQKESDSLIINFECINNHFNSLYIMSFEEGKLMLTDPLCDEGCIEVYERLTAIQ